MSEPAAPTLPVKLPYMLPFTRKSPPMLALPTVINESRLARPVVVIVPLPKTEFADAFPIVNVVRVPTLVIFGCALVSTVPAKLA